MRKRSLGPVAHVVLFMLFASGIGISRLAFRNHFAQQLARFGRSSAHQMAEHRRDHWNRLEFTPVTNENFNHRFISTVNWTNLPLDSRQASSLEGRLLLILNYLEKPTFEAYYNLRTDGIHYRFKSRIGTTTTEAVLAPPGQVVSSVDAFDATRHAWDQILTRAGKREVAGLSGVCLTQVAACIATTNTAHALLSGAVRKGFTTAKEASNPGFAQSSPIPTVFFHMSFFAKVGTNNNAGPVYISLSWLPEDETWGLSRLISDNWLDLQILF